MKRSNLTRTCIGCGNPFELPRQKDKWTCSKICESRVRRRNVVDWHKDQGHRLWDEENIVISLRQFYDKHGKVPSSTDSRRYKDLPANTQVIDHFGSWNNAIEAAGFPIRPIGWSAESRARVRKFGNERKLKKTRVKCKECGRTFWAWRKTAMFCSNACRCKDYYRRHS
jgi:hypothetical protein